MTLSVDEDSVQYSFEYPDYYEHTTPLRRGSYSYNSVLVYLAYPKTSGSKVISSFSFLVNYSPYDRPRSPTAEVEHWIGVYSASSDFRLVEHSSRKVGGEVAAEFAYFNTPGIGPDSGEGIRFGVLYLWREAFFNRADRQYSVTWSAPAEVARCFWDDFDHVLDTFKFLD